jgi:hypothetical protein
VLKRQEYCEVIDESYLGGPGSGYPCGKRVVECPACGKMSDFCANHLIDDPEFHPEYPNGVCADCEGMPTTPNPQPMLLPPLRSARQ